MSILKNIFDTIAGWYGTAFNDWLHIHFGIRTLILLLCTWAAVFLAVQLIKYVIGPLLILFYYHVLFRAWNFIFIETFQEWIYINYYSREKPFLSGTYLKLCDKIKNNRLKLEYTRYKGIVIKRSTARTARVLTVLGITAGTLWVAAFGLYYEYAYEPPAGGIAGSGLNGSLPRATDSAGNFPDGTGSGGVPSGSVSPEGMPPDDESFNEGVLNGALPGGNALSDNSPANISPAIDDTAANGFGPAFSDDLFWLDSEYLYLNEFGTDGANIRDLPDGTQSTVVEVVWGGAELENLGAYYEDAASPGMYWIKVRTASGTEGYVSSRLMQTEAQTD